MAFTVATGSRPGADHLERVGSVPSGDRSVADVNELDYTPLVLGALHAAGVVLAGNALVTVVVANAASVTTEIRFLWSFVPYVALVADESRFATVTTRAALVGAAALGAWLVWSALRGSLDRLARAGRLSAVPMAAAIGVLQLVRLRAVDAAGGASLRSLGLAFAILAVAAASAGWIVRHSFADDTVDDVGPSRSIRTSIRPRTSPAAPDEPAPSAEGEAPAPSPNRSGFRRHLRLPSQEDHR